MTTQSDNGVSQGQAPGHAPPERRRPAVIAHRGASRAHPENTLAAFAGAASLGAGWVEFDVRRTADGALIIHHDAALPDGRVLIETVRADLPPSVPTLVETLELCAGRGLSVNVEIKSDPREPDFDDGYAVAELVAPLLAADPAFTNGTAGHLVTSFDHRCLDRVREVAPSLRTGQLAFDITDVERLMQRAVAAGHVAVNPWDPFVDERFMALAREAGLEVYPWTVDDPERLRALIALGVDGIITNVPDVLRDVLDTPDGIA
jgi:glycerophosphoryl diester phosphodiesterase